MAVRSLESKSRSSHTLRNNALELGQKGEDFFTADIDIFGIEGW